MKANRDARRPGIASPSPRKRPRALPARQNSRQIKAFTSARNALASRRL
ncbi:hypothetical protein C4K23_4291 [Pseudomonas chlororaphis]|nr:hypothetical protein C4K23_4291 [Pseudomonas chlororaphis]